MHAAYFGRIISIIIILSILLYGTCLNGIQTRSFFAYRDFEGYCAETPERTAAEHTPDVFRSVYGNIPVLETLYSDPGDVSDTDFYIRRHLSALEIIFLLSPACTGPFFRFRDFVILSEHPGVHDTIISFVHNQGNYYS